MGRRSRLTGWCTRLVWLAGTLLPLLLLPLLLLTPDNLQAQAPASNAAAISGQVSAPQGSPAVSAQVRICPITASQAQCVPLALLYTNSALTVQTSNPISTDAYGNYKVFVAAGLYLVQITVSPGLTYTYYAAAGSSGSGASSAPPAYSVQYASNLVPGQFLSDPTIFINPVGHILTTPELFVPGSGTGLIGITGQTSLSTVYQTVADTTAGWTYTWPPAAPTQAECIVVQPSGVAGFQTCVTSGNYLPISGGTLTGPLIAPIINAQYSPDATIAAAVTSAGTTGSVTIPASYTGTDTACLYTSGANCTTPPNPQGVAMDDQRRKSSTSTPKNLIYASDFGAVCSGTSIDSPAIQAAINTAVWAYNYSLSALEENEVVLPQGTCGVISPLTFTGFHGSMVGAGDDATYLVGLFNQWVGTDYTVLELTATGTQAGGTSVGQRRFSNFTVIGNFNGPSSGIQSTGIKILNTSNIYNPSEYGLAGISFDHLLVGQFDTCIDAQDMINSQFQFNKIQNCRIGLQFNGDVNNNFVDHTTIAAGTLAFTNQTGSTTGFNIILNTKYGGGFEQPQGVFFHDNSIENWTIDLHIQECIACDFHDNQIDLAGVLGIQVDENGIGGYGVWIHHNLIGVNSNAGTGIFLAGITDTTENYQNMGFWVTDNQFQLDSFPTVLPSSNVGINVTGLFPIYGAHITGNQFVGMGTGIVLNQALINSYIRDNNCVYALTSCVNLSGASSLNHTFTVVDGNIDNIDSVPAVNIGTAIGFRMGSNVSATQWTGTQDVSVAACTISSGAIGDQCSNTVTLANQIYNTSYNAVCQANGGSGLWTVGPIGTKTETTFPIPSVALTTTATGAGTITCHVTSQQ